MISRQKKTITTHNAVILIKSACNEKITIITIIMYFLKNVHINNLKNTIS